MAGSHTGDAVGAGAGGDVADRGVGSGVESDSVIWGHNGVGCDAGADGAGVPDGTEVPATVREQGAATGGLSAGVRQETLGEEGRAGLTSGTAVACPEAPPAARDDGAIVPGQAPMSEITAFARVVAIVRQLRGPRGCPWDRVQTHDSLTPYVLEEAHEVVVAVGECDSAALCEELGDLLLQVLLHAAIGQAEGAFTLGDVLRGLAAKLVRRHPHVFGGAAPVQSVDEVARHWAAAKAEESRPSDAVAPGQGRMATVRRGQPALSEARALGVCAAEAGFDWDGPVPAWPKLAEEEAEFGQAWQAWLASGANDAGARRHMAEEFGDLLFSAVQVGRLLGLDGEVCLRQANAKFRRRFSGMEQLLAAEGWAMPGLTLAQLDHFWDRVKAREVMTDGSDPADGRHA